MRRRLPLVTLALAACTSAGSARLQGHWRGVRALGVPDEAIASANKFASQMEIDIQGDTVRVSTVKETTVGHFRVAREDPSQVVITTDRDGPTDPQSFTFTDERTMRWAVLPGKTIEFTKQ